MVTLKSQYEWSYGHLTVKKEVSASSYLIVQLTWAKLYTLIKDEKRDILILLSRWSPNMNEVMATLQWNYAVFNLQLLYCSADLTLIVHTY